MYIWSDGHADHPSMDLTHSTTYQLLSSSAFCVMCAAVHMLWTLYVLQKCASDFHPSMCPVVAYVLPRAALLGLQDLHVATLMLQFERCANIVHACMCWLITELLVIGLTIITFDIRSAMVIVVICVYSYVSSLQYRRRVCNIQDRCNTVHGHGRMDVCNYEEFADTNV